MSFVAMVSNVFTNCLVRDVNTRVSENRVVIRIDRARHRF